MLVIGPHISISKGFGKAAQTAVDIGANTFQFFSRNPRGGNAKEFDEKDIEKFQKIRKEYNFGPLLAHAPYTMNLGGSKDEVYEFGRKDANSGTPLSGKNNKSAPGYRSAGKRPGSSEGGCGTYGRGMRGRAD